MSTLGIRTDDSGRLRLMRLRPKRRGGRRNGRKFSDQPRANMSAAELGRDTLQGTARRSLPDISAIPRGWPLLSGTARNGPASTDALGAVGFTMAMEARAELTRTLPARQRLPLVDDGLNHRPRV